MPTSTSTFTSTSTQLFQEFFEEVYSRRLLLHKLGQSSTAAAPPPPSSHNPSDPYNGDNTFDANVVMVLSVLLCALICSLGLNSIIRCALRCSGLVASESGLDTECAICLSEFAPGERVRLLPKCNHGFHVRCIDKWLSSHSSCPTCRQCLIETCQKIVVCCQASSSEPAQPVQETIVHIAPLEPEGLTRDYR